MRVTCQVGEQKYHFWSGAATLYPTRRPNKKIFQKSNAVLFWRDKFCSLPDGANRANIGQAMHEKRCEFVPTLGPVRGARPLPAISPRPLNESQPNFPGKRQMRWNSKYVVQTSEICRGVRLGQLLIAFLQHAPPRLVTKELTHARSCVRRSTNSIAIHFVHNLCHLTTSCASYLILRLCVLL